MTTALKQRKVDFNDNEVREAVASDDLHGFVCTCLPHYVSLPSAEFHYVLSEVLGDPKYDLVELIGFRDSAKSTYASLALPLFAALTGRYKFIVVINDTSKQAELSLANIKYELEHNRHIKMLFPTVVAAKTWSGDNLLLSNGVRIIARSRGENIRGIRHRQTRPDLIIVDDPENLMQVRKKENRDKTEQWFNAEVVPARQSFGAKLVVIGNLLHNDSFISRLAKNQLFKVIKIPLIDPETKKVAWVAKYPNKEALQKKRREVGETAWAREYLLKIISEEDQVIKETDIQRYPNEILTKRDDKGNLCFKILDAGVGTDLAISERQTADFTAMISGLRVEWNGKHILIKPRPVNERMNFDKTLKRAVEVADTMPMGTKFFVEDVGYQKAALQQLSKRLSVYPMRPITDKKARLQSVAPFIKDGTVLFPEQGCEDLIAQLIGFGVEEHDDMVDALVYLILGIINSPTAVRVVGRIDKI